MTDLAARILDQGRLILTLVAVFMLAGLIAFFQMNRQENPSFPYRAGLITITFAGAAPDRIERLVLKPLEEQIAEVEQVRVIDATARQGVAVLRVQLGDEVYDTDAAWDRIRVAMDDAAREYPAGVGKAQLDDRIIDASTVVLAVTGSDDALRLADAAKTLRQRLLGLDGVASTRIYGDPGKQITVAVDDAAMNRNALSPAGIAADIRAGNQVAAGGAIRLAGASVDLKPDTDFNSIDDIRASAIALPGGATLPLAAIARVYESAAVPPRDRLWYDGRRAVGVEIVAARNTTNVVAFGQRLRAAVDDVRDDLAPLHVHEMFYQPAQTEKRLSNLTWSLLVSIAIILAVLFVFMGWRMGVIVAVLLPLVTLTAVALYALGGGVLQQIAVIGLVVALGILVDNAIVMTENVQWHLNAGAAPDVASARSIRELAGPLLAATGTTLAAFVPMLLAKGNTADFTRALPITIMLALAVSYVFAITVTPLISRRFLKARTEARREPIQALANGLAHATTRFPVVWIALGVIAIAVALACTRLIDTEFFPQADRTQVVVDLTLPEGTHLATTTAAARTLESALRARPGVQAVHAFIGTGGPTFYYNLQNAPHAPQRARLVVITDALSRNRAVIDFVDRYSRGHLPQADIVASVLSQGPPTAAPIEVRVFNDEPQRLVTATERIFHVALSLPGARDVRHDLGTGVPSLDYDVRSAVARSYGVTPADVAEALRSRSQGLPVGQYRAERDPMPIKLRSPQGERISPTALATTNIYNGHGEGVPLMQVATTHLAVQPGAIRHYNQRRVAHVYSELAAGGVYSQVLGPLKQRIAQLALPPGTDVEYGGDAEESGKANTALFTTAPLGIALLLFFLLVQFNSFVRMLLVLLTAPFALVGVVPGLLLLGIPFGFMPLLGMIALTGIVVNNAIVLIDVIDQRLGEDADVATAIADAVRRRTRPIILTTATTIAGLLPLAFSRATLWPPLAWTIITGLLASTLLTLLVLPALCRLLLRPQRMTASPRPAVLMTAVMLLVATLPATGHDATPATRMVTLGQSLQLGRNRARVEADRMRARAAGAKADEAVRAGRYPTLSARAFASRSDTVARVDSNDFKGDFAGAASLPDISVPLGDRDRYGATVELRQPVLDAATQLYGGPAARHSAKAAGATLERSRLVSMTDAAGAYLDALSVRARLEANQSLIDNLRARADRVRALRQSGRALNSDVLELRFARRQTRQRQSSLSHRLHVAETALARALGLDGRVTPAALDFTPPAVIGSDARARTEKALSQRQDIAALDARIHAAELKIKQARAARLPTVDAVASLNYNQGNLFLPEREGRIGAELTWRPFAGGTLSARRSAAEAQLAVLRAQRRELARGVRLQVEQALADWRDARDRQKLAALGIESARATRDTRAARLDAGRANTDDVLDAEATLAARRATARIAAYDSVRAWINLQRALGDDGALTRVATRDLTPGNVDHDPDLSQPPPRSRSGHLPAVKLEGSLSLVRHGGDW